MQWKDFGIEIYELYKWIKLLPDVVMVQVLGLEGTGKSMGIKALNPETTYYLNADGKPLSFFGARKLYREKITPEERQEGKTPNMKIPYTYDDVKAFITNIHAKRRGTLVVFLLGHIENYNLPLGGVGQRLRVLGKQATKLGIEGLNFVHTYYTKIDPTAPQNDPNRYKLEVFNSGFNTARSPEGFWEGDIPNNYQLILERILEDTGEIEQNI